ncbi:MAG: InlB B-repeat-containing protein, partial [Prevotella sp.]|nr:InlB B-repeat-containing protein [Prevotella sp.]
KCLYVGQHCYIWTPTSTASNVYPLDKIDSSFAKLAADEFDSKFSLMQSSFGTHTNGSQGDGKLSILYYNINDGWEPGKGYVGGFFYSPDISNNGLPILNIDTYPGVYYKNNSTGAERKSMDYTYNTMVHEYQHLINYSHTSNMSSWLNECFSAAAEEICYPGSSVVSRIQSWEDYSYSDNNDWLNPPAEFKYNSSFNLHKGYSMYAWDNNLDDVLALYSQVSFFAQYLYTRFGNTIYQQISNKFSSGEVAAITSATGVNCADLVRDFRVAVTANASQDQYDGKYGFKVQPGYDPAKYNNVQNPWSLLKPVVFTGSSCSIKGGGAITVKPVNGVYNPPSGASSSLKYIGIKINKTNPSTQYTVSAVSNNTSWGTVSVNGNVITATPANGYYVADAQVIAGTATYSINGNVITVNPSSDCTIQVNFAAKTSVTVTYVSSGAVVGTKTVYVQESVTLPSSVNNTPSGWTFIGWTENQVEQTQNKPTYYAPGASYTVPRNITLYALYKKGQATGSVKAYELVTSAPSNWTGNYVITSGTDSNMLILKGLSGTTAHQNSSGASSLSASGATLNGTRLENVNDLYVFRISASGSSWYSSGYTLQNKSTGTYLYADSTNGFYSVEVQYSSGMTWGLAYSNGCMRISNSAVYSHPYLARIFDYDYFGMTNRYDTDYPTQLWKETEGTTEVEIYWTNPNAHTHSLQYVAAVAATCTNAGHSAYYYCSGCNKYFSDSNAQNEITLASTNIP